MRETGRKRRNKKICEHCKCRIAQIEREIQFWLFYLPAGRPEYQSTLKGRLKYLLLRSLGWIQYYPNCLQQKTNRQLLDLFDLFMQCKALAKRFPVLKALNKQHPSVKLTVWSPTGSWHGSTSETLTRFGASCVLTAATGTSAPPASKQNSCIPKEKKKETGFWKQNSDVSRANCIY